MGADQIYSTIKQILTTKEICYTKDIEEKLGKNIQDSTRSRSQIDRIIRQNMFHWADVNVSIVKTQTAPKAYAITKREKNERNLSYLRNNYGVPAKIGGRIRFDHDGREGTIVGGDSRLLVRFDGEKKVTRLHPTWKIEYLD